MISWSAFSYCRSLESLSLPNSTESIGSNAFEGCSSLTSVIIPASVTHIGYYAFHACAVLTFAAYEGCQYFSEDAFADCYALKYVLVHQCYTESTFCQKPVQYAEEWQAEEVLSWYVQDGRLVISSLSDIPASMTDFTESSKPSWNTQSDIVTSVELIKLKNIGDYAFDGFTLLDEAVFDESLESIGSFAFHSCPSLKRMIMPSSLTTDSDDAFSGCPRLCDVECWLEQY